MAAAQTSEAAPKGPPSPSSPPPGLHRSIGPWQAAALVVGSIVGTGVFLKTATMAQLLGSMGGVLAAWVIAGVLSYAGALSYSELCARIPSSGGEYAILRESWGPLPAFLYGWTRFWIGSPGTIAAYSVGAATFLGGVIPLGTIIPGGEKTAAVVFIVLFTGLNCLEVAFGAAVQTFLTGLKVLLILTMIGGIVFFADASHASHAASSSSSSSLANAGGSAFGLALISALWAYDGWNNLPMVGGEVREPHRNIPIALGVGVFVVVALYVGVNAAFFRALSVEEIQQANSSLHPDALPVATLAAQGFLGRIGVPALSVAFVISAVGAMNGAILTGARVPFAMADDGLFFRRLARIHPRTGVPIGAVVTQGLWSSGLAMSGTFDQLTDYVVVTSWVFYGLVTSSLFVLRRREQPGSRPRFSVPGYPVVPLLFIAAAVFLIGNSVWRTPVQAVIGALLLAAGLPVYVYFRRRLRVESAAPPA
jgi:APA family basic amino acid/polyamine antiporter